MITTFLGVGIMGLTAPLPMDRIRLLNPGERLTCGDRTLTAFRPPVFDNPSTTGFHDSRSNALLQFGLLWRDAQDVPQNAAEINDKALRDGQVFWATVDSPWLHKVDRQALAGELEAIRRMAPAMILSSHLPAAPGRIADRLLAAVADAPSASPFVGPNQAALEQMLSGNTGDRT